MQVCKLKGTGRLNKNMPEATLRTSIIRQPCACDEALCFNTQVNLLRLLSYGNSLTKMSRFGKILK